jgi:hypothetical protein
MSIIRLLDLALCDEVIEEVGLQVVVRSQVERVFGPLIDNKTFEHTVPLTDDLLGALHSLTPVKVPPRHDSPH